MSSNNGCEGILLWSVLCVALGYCIGSCVNESSWKSEVVKRGHAHYHEKSAVFTWNEDKK